MGISGGHLNPAVTLGLLVGPTDRVPDAGRRTSSRSSLGAVLAALLIKAVYPLGVVRPISLGTPTIANTIQLHQAIAHRGDA